MQAVREKPTYRIDKKGVPAKYPPRQRSPSLYGNAVWKRSELDLRSLTVRFVDLEVRRLLEVEQSGDDVGRHDLDLGVVLLHHIVIELAGVGDFLLERLELGLQVQKFWLACSCGYASATAWRFMIARLSWFSAWMRCATSPDCAAWSALARAWVTCVNTCDSWAAYPLTVSTRFGMRSARCLSCTSICAQPF